MLTIIQFTKTCSTGDYVPEHVGPPVACCQVKLVDVPDMEYYASGNQGEVCVRGTNVFVGYFKEPELTNNTIDDTNWHHTGDIGQWLPVNIFVTFYTSNVSISGGFLSLNSIEYCETNGFFIVLSLSCSEI